MPTTWTQINTELGVILEDTSAVSYSSDLRIACFNRAMEYFAVTHTALFKTASATADANSMIAYPEDFLDIPDGGVEVLWKTKSRWLEMQELIPGTAIPKEGYAKMHNGIRLFTTEFEDIKLWYFSKYPSVVNGNSTILLPAWSHWAVMNLACAYMLYPGMMNQQLLRQFQTRRDAGSPDDNPPRTQAKFLMMVYLDTVSKVKTQDRGYIMREGRL
jgi:hypothetical protein